MPDEIREAISYIPPDDRETWVHVGMAVKDELGDAGFEVWDAWSAQSDRYRPRDAKAVWRSFRGRGVTVATLYKLAREHGWEGQGEAPRRERPRVVREDQDESRRHAQARQRAQRMISEAGIARHAYLISKGFREAEGLVLSHMLLIPMRDMQTGELNSVQTITWDGQKKFLPGGKARGSVFVIGSGPETWFVEGYVSGLSVREALRSLYRQARVVVCFSAGNLRHVAKGARSGFVYADNDESGTGQAAAVATGLPWVMSHITGNDANDDHQHLGVGVVAERIREAMRQRA